MVVLFLSVSAGVFFFDLFCGGMVSCFFGWNTVGANVGGPKNRRESPNTEVHNTNHTSHESCKKETRNLRKYELASKVVNPFTRALAPPFIGRWRDFLHSENTLESREYS
jgi:hypothetical protein